MKKSRKSQRSGKPTSPIVLSRSQGSPENGNTQSPYLLNSMGQRVIVLEQGGIVENGKPTPKQSISLEFQYGRSRITF